MKPKKAQGLSLNTIIIAAVALIVLVVLVMIFTGRMGGFSTGVSRCENQGGRCLNAGTTPTLTGGNCPADYREVPGVCSEGKCCITP
tara:strand:- start:142 stop:402 length:261 start_codon:yes stop_codon:yes gene_type:complete